MTINFRTAALTAVGTLLISTSVHAQEAGPYVGVGIGLTKPTTTNINDTTNRSVKFDRGTIGALSLGYAFGNHWRAEAELSRRSNGLDTVSGAAAGGNLRNTSAMANVLYDFDINSPVTPYLGAGIGMSQVKLRNATPFGASSINDSDRAVAMQGIAGLSYALSNSADLFADYRYMNARNFDMVTAAGESTSFDLVNHSVMVGLRFNFGGPAAKPEPKPMVQAAAAAPAPAPAPAPALPRNYIVFFDWNQTEITPEAAAIIRTASANANGMSVVRLDLTGHADRSGTDAYNLKLSQRRADAVMAMFKDMGFKANEISVVAKGETDPLVPTDDGVREPQNRRVEIVLP